MTGFLTGAPSGASEPVSPPVGVKSPDSRFGGCRPVACETQMRIM